MRVSRTERTFPLRARYRATGLAFTVALGLIARTMGLKAEPPAGVNPPSVNPGINANFLDPDLDVDRFVDTFETESREIYSARDAIVAAIGLKPGDRVADVGTGTGLFVRPLSESVGPDGWVFALDIAPKFLRRVAAIVDAGGLSNVTPVLCGEDSVSLPPDSVDVVFLCDVYHHFEYPTPSLASIRRSLRPGGRLILVDFERIEGVSRDWVLGHVRADKATFRKEIEAAGFTFVDEADVPGLSENYFLRFRLDR